MIVDEKTPFFFIPCFKMNGLISAAILFPLVEADRYRLGRSKLVFTIAGFLSNKLQQISLTTSGVAVAVTVKKGTPGKADLITFRFLKINKYEKNHKNSMHN